MNFNETLDAENLNGVFDNDYNNFKIRIKKVNSTKNLQPINYVCTMYIIIINN